MSRTFPVAVSLSASPIKLVGLWIRVSTEDQAAGDSPKHHEARARHYAASKEWTVAEVYDLAGVSGKAVMEHPEAKRMMEDIRQGRISALIFSKLARLTRNARELMDFSDFFREHNADLISLQESIDTSTPSGRLFYNMCGVMAQWEREEIADRVKSSVAIRAKLGKVLGATVYGYVNKDDQIQVDPAEGPVRKLIYELFLEQKRKKTVARILNDRGYRTRNGGKWSDTTVGRLIQDTSAKGVYRSNYSKSLGKGAVGFKPEHEWVFTAVDPIVTEDVWNRCNEILEGRKTRRERPGRRPVHLFTNIAHCECGYKLYVPSNTPKYVCYKCRNKIPIVDLEALFVDEFEKYLVAPESIAAYMSQANAEIGTKERLAETCRKDLSKAKAEVERVFSLYMDGGLNATQFKERHDPLGQKKKALEEELPRLEAEISLLQVAGLSEEAFQEEARNLRGRWEKMNGEERRRMVELLATKIVIGDGEVTFHLSYIPRIEELTERQRTLRGSSRPQA